MRLDFLADPALYERWLVLDADTGEAIENVAWADDTARAYATFKLRPKTMADPPGVDLRIRSADGSYALTQHTSTIEFVERQTSPLKGEFLALLDDPEVRSKIRGIAVVAALVMSEAAAN